jgi:homoserine O-acetyltransferase
MAHCLKELGKVVEYHLIVSAYGHDSFLLEHETFAPLVSSFIAGVDGL